MSDLLLDGGGTREFGVETMRLSQDGRSLSGPEMELLPDLARLVSSSDPWQFKDPRLAAEAVLNMRTVIATVDGIPIGAACVMPHVQKHPDQPLATYLETVVVKPELRRSGIGSRLVGHAARLAIDSGDRRLVIRRPNEGSTEFFGKLGFDADGQSAVVGAALGLVAARARIISPSE